MNHKRAFTLIEMMIVIAVIALLSALTFGAISSTREGNKRGTCQANLNQIYLAARAYAQDFDGQFPYLNPPGGPSSSQTPQGGLGLWALYAYPPKSSDALKDANCNGIADDLPPRRNDPLTDAPLASYIKTARVFHCPSDNFERPVMFSSGATCGSKTLNSGELSFDPGDGIARLNPTFLSYQGQDDAPASPIYASFRGSGEKRQLRFYSGSGTTISTPDRRALDQTVVTWCRFHRGLNDDGTTRSGDNSFDNVLFLDGSVHSVRRTQPVTDTAGTTKTCESWRRVPLSEADSSPPGVVASCN